MPGVHRGDAGLYSRQFLECQMMVGLARRVAEEVLFGPDDGRLQRHETKNLGFHAAV